MGSFAEDMAASRRLAILRFLREAGGSANESILKTMLAGIRIKGPLLGDGVRSDLKFLAEHDLVVAEMYAGGDGGVMGADITKRGMAYLAREIEAIAGVKLPDMGV
ncbi:hypothetical protein HDIA_2262 [Hartmannibacter diazotrophicus]|uniref:Uncharacterized protein n=1 Tax=Hartmannibacter diazotrophicus TaxID=1482074 RepID=A0A2C9D6D0_9HYPH|nr:hypothetical protein [Hartmannibacter diazotrophicus]SON55803.1 hypothetical protein HDIA_2262 [Hartmannibacter diazotrophicus]